MSIHHLRRLQHSWFSQLLFAVIAAGLLMATGLRAAPHSHQDEGLGAAQQVLLALNHAPAVDTSNEESAAASTHVHYSASLSFVTAAAHSPLLANRELVGSLRAANDRAPPRRDVDTQHRPPIV